MIKVKIIACGNLKESYFKAAADEYIKRLRGYCDLTVTEVPIQKIGDNPSEKEVENALKKEAEVIIKNIPEKSEIVSLCVEGKKFSSEKLSELIKENANYKTGSITFVIGSSYGLSESIKKISDVKMSVSDMTFPHKLFRIMLLEQIYRAFKIAEGSDYHK